MIFKHMSNIFFKIFNFFYKCDLYAFFDMSFQHSIIQKCLNHKLKEYKGKKLAKIFI